MILLEEDVVINEMGLLGEALVWIIDGDCLYDLPLKKEYVDMFINHDAIQDISLEYPNHDGLAVRIIKDENIICDFLTSEYFGSILLSNPLVLFLKDYPYGRYVISPHAKFDGEKFIILDQPMDGLLPWYSEEE
jgi:hypothetical protein